jgi:hypothetical protein
VLRKTIAGFVACDRRCLIKHSKSVGRGKYFRFLLLRLKIDSM